jgi:Na+/H+-dicarboxylate symporter
MKRVPLHVQIFIALVLAVAAGLITGQNTRLGVLSVVDAYAFVGDLFLNALKMLVVPLVVAAVITGIAGIGSTTGFGRLGVKTLAYYATTTLLAVLLGLLLVNPAGRGSCRWPRTQRRGWNRSRGAACLMSPESFNVSFPPTW